MKDKYGNAKHRIPCHDWTKKVRNYYGPYSYSNSSDTRIVSDSSDVSDVSEDSDVEDPAFTSDAVWLRKTADAREALKMSSESKPFSEYCKQNDKRFRLPKRPRALLEVSQARWNALPPEKKRKVCRRSTKKPIHKTNISQCVSRRPHGHSLGAFTTTSIIVDHEHLHAYDAEDT